MPEGDVEQGRDNLAQLLGERPDNIDINTNWSSNVLQKGVIVSLHIGRWRGTTQISREDLGLNDLSDEDYEEFFGNYVKLGTQYLISSDLLKKLDKIETRARRTLEQHGFKTLFGAFMPYTTYQEFKADLAAIESDYEQVRDELYVDFDTHVDLAKESYSIAARQAYSARNFGSEAPQQYIDQFVERVIKQIPSRDYVKSKFYFRAMLQYLPMASAIAADEQQARDIQEEHIGMRRMNEDIRRQYVEDRGRYITSFLTDIRGHMANLMFDSCKAAIDSIENNDTLISRNSRSLTDLVEKINKLNFIDDKEVGAMISELRASIDMDAKDRDISQIKSKLEDITIITRQALTEAGYSRSKRSFVVEPVTPVQLRTARRNIGIDEVSAPIESTRAKRGGEST